MKEQSGFEDLLGATRRGLLFGGTALASGLLLTSVAIAQDSGAADDDELEEFEEVVVTGSRIKRDSFSSATPMDVIAAEDAVRMGHADLASMIRSSTVAAGSPQVTSATSTAFVQNGGAGTETISLRGLGANRTLSLLNGRRAGPAGTRGSVSSFDMNVLPLAGIESVEILKDGASSIYGSDAVAGVVNYITKKGDGGELSAYASIPTVSGGETYQVSGSYGKKFDRGYFRVTGDYYREEELAKGDREYFQCGEAYIFEQGTDTRADLIDPRTGEYKCRDWGWGHVWTYDYAEYNGGDFTTNIPSGGTLIQYDYGGHLAANGLPSLNELADPSNPYHMRTPDGWYPVGYDPISDALFQYDHPFQNEESLIPKKELFTVMAEGEYQVNDHMTVYAEALFNRRKTYQNHYTQYWSYVYNDNWDFYSYDIDDAAGGALAEGWTGAQWFSPTPVIDHADGATNIDYTRFVLGVKGTFGESDWDYDLSSQYSKSDAEYWSQIIYKDSVWSNNPYGWQPGPFYGKQGYIPGSRTCEGQTTAVLGMPCIDIPWLDPEVMRGNLTQAQRDFLLGEETGTTVYKNYSIELSLTNSNLFELPAGPVGVAVGGQYMYDSINDQPGDQSQMMVDGEGIGNVWGSGWKQPTIGSHNTKAIYAEAIIPVFHNTPMVQQFDLELSGRYTDVSSYGSGETYKVGVNWTVNDTVRFRAGRGTSFRSPALFELFVKAESSFIRQSLVDPCYRWGDALGNGDITQRMADNCASQGAPMDHTASITADVLAGGGVGNLDAETSVSHTAGVILTPDFADLRLSIDYFDIEVKGEIDQFGARNIVYECYDSENFPADPLCSLFDRIPFSSNMLPGMITEVRDSYINIASQKSRGWDIEAVYNTTLPNDIQLNIHTQHTITTTDETEIFEGFPDIRNGLAGHPKWVGNLTISAFKGPWTATWNMRGVGSTSKRGRQ